MGSPAGPVDVEPMPGYLELISRASAVMLDAWTDCSGCGLELSTRTLLENANITWTEIGLFFFCAFLWTQVRKGLTQSLFKIFLDIPHPADSLEAPLTADNMSQLLAGMWLNKKKWTPIDSGGESRLQRNVNGQTAAR